MRKATNNLRPVVLATAAGCKCNYNGQPSYRNEMIYTATRQFETMTEKDTYWLAGLYRDRGGVSYLAMLTHENSEADLAIVFDKGSQDSMLAIVKSFAEQLNDATVFDDFIHRTKEVMPHLLAGLMPLENINKIPSNHRYYGLAFECRPPALDHN